MIIAQQEKKKKNPVLPLFGKLIKSNQSTCKLLSCGQGDKPQGSQEHRLHHRRSWRPVAAQKKGKYTAEKKRALAHIGDCLLHVVMFANSHIKLGSCP